MLKKEINTTNDLNCEYCNSNNMFIEKDENSYIVFCKDCNSNNVIIKTK